MIITAKLRQILTSNIKGTIIFDEPMAGYTSLRLGGKADSIAMPEDIGSLKFIINFAQENGIKVFYIGSGTNLIVRDCGIILPALICIWPTSELPI